MAMTPDTLNMLAGMLGEGEPTPQFTDEMRAHARVWQDLIDTALEVVKAVYSPAALDAGNMAAMDRLARLVGFGGPGPVTGPLGASQEPSETPR